MKFGPCPNTESAAKASRRLDIDRLLATGAIEGPSRAAKPTTRWTLLARRAYRALWVFAQTIAVRRAANRKD